MAVDRQAVLNSYPQYAWLLDNPEVAGVFDQAYAIPDQPWSVGRLVAAIQATTWWKKTEPSVRTFQEQMATDPTAVEEGLREREAKVWDQVRSLGLNLDANAVREMAKTAYQFNLSENQILDSLVGKSQAQGYMGVESSLGTVQTTIDELKNKAARYYVNIDDQTAYNFAMTVANGEHKSEDYDALFKEQAKARFSFDEQMVKQIDAGFTPEAILQPQKAKIAQLLEVGQDAINLNDQKYSQLLDMADPTTGKRRVATESEAAKFARGMDEWKSTQNASEAGSKLLGNIKEMFEGSR